MLDKLRIGTRGSPLALAQANLVRDMLLAAHPHLTDVEIVVIQTKGDAILDRPLAEIGGKGLFTQEIEEQLLDGRVDLAVHSSKDMPTELPEGLSLPIFLEREDPRDAFIGNDGVGLMDLPQGCIVGTASLRRQAQVLRARPDVSVVSIRGNVGTRLKKIKQEKLGGTLLAVAGLNRLGLAAKATEVLSEDIMLPAPAQGAIAIEVRSGDAGVLRLLEALNHKETVLCVTCERSLLAQLDGSCRTPIAALAKLDGDSMTLKAKVFSLDGTQCFEASGNCVVASIGDAEALGQKIGLELISKAGQQFFEDLKSAVSQS